MSLLQEFAETVGVTLHNYPNDDFVITTETKIDEYQKVVITKHYHNGKLLCDEIYYCKSDIIYEFTNYGMLLLSTQLTNVISNRIKQNLDK